MEIVFHIACGFLLLLLLLLAHGGVHDVVGGQHHNNNITMEGDLELEKQLKLLNKPAVKTITTDDGDIYDCVDINKQPALDNPLLKDHKVQLKPSSFPTGMFDDSSLKNSSIQIGLTNGGCPSGTVPLRRFTKEDLARIKSSPLSNRNIYTSKPPIDVPINKKWAILQTNGGQSFYGAGGFLVVYGLTELTMRQISSSLIWIVNDRDSQNQEYVEAGWTVSPELYGDSKSRLNSGWSGIAHAGCMDITCPGFVQVSKKIPLGIPLQPVSVIGGIPYGAHWLIYKDPDTKNWWLMFGVTEPVGYWPSKLFNKLADNATRIDMGGYVGYWQGTKRSKMGNGIYPKDDNHDACFTTEIKTVDKDNELVDIGWNQAHSYETSFDCYRINRKKYYMFYFGGPQAC